jgi:uncharacterized RDD family membrane protein YckC
MVAPGLPAIHHALVEDFSVYQAAGFIRRWYALALDLVFFAPLDLMVHMPFTRYVERLYAFGDTTKAIGLTTLLFVIPMMLYFVAPTMIWGQTLGKKIVGVRVVRGDYGGSLGLGQVLARETIGKALSVATLLIGFFMVGWAKNKRGLHDRLADTRVVCYRDRWS